MDVQDFDPATFEAQLIAAIAKQQREGFAFAEVKQVVLDGVKAWLDRLQHFGEEEVN